MVWARTWLCVTNVWHEIVCHGVWNLFRRQRTVLNTANSTNRRAATTCRKIIIPECSDLILTPPSIGQAYLYAARQSFWSEEPFHFSSFYCSVHISPRRQSAIQLSENGRTNRRADMSLLWIIGRQSRVLPSFLPSCATSQKDVKVGHYTTRRILGQIRDAMHYNDNRILWQSDIVTSRLLWQF